MERLNPLNDYIFRKLLGEKGDEEQLLSFLNAVLKRSNDDKLSQVEILENRTITAEIIGNKTSVLDVRAVTENGTKVNLDAWFTRILKTTHCIDGSHFSIRNPQKM